MNDDKMQRIDESIAKQLERSIKLNCELRISVWNAAIEEAAKLTYNRGSRQCMNAAMEIRKLKK